MNNVNSMNVQVEPCAPRQHDILKELEDLHIPCWGFVVLRCTYASDEAWAMFMNKLKEEITHTQLKTRTTHNDQSELEAKLVWTVIEDRERLDGVYVQQASLRFRQWLEVEGRNELGLNEPPPAYNPMETGSFLTAYTFPRYEYYIYADSKAVASVLRSEQAPGRTSTSYVHLVDYKWNLRPEIDIEEDGYHDNEEHGSTHPCSLKLDYDNEDFGNTDRWPLEPDDEAQQRIRTECFEEFFTRCLPSSKWDMDYRWWDVEFGPNVYMPWLNH